MPHETAGARTPASRLADWMAAWDGTVRALLAERPGAAPDVLRPLSPTGIGLAIGMLAALVAVLAKVGPHPFLPVMFLAFAVLYLALVPLDDLLRHLGLRGRKLDAAELTELAEAAAQSLRDWEETASRAVAAWHLARESALRALEPLAESDPAAPAAAARIRALVPPVAPLPEIDVGPLRRAASTPLTQLPSLDGWGAVTGGVVYMARRKPFTTAELLVVLCGVTVVPPSLFLAIDGVADVVTCAVVPAAACSGAAGRRLFLLGSLSIAGVAVLWRAVTRTRVDCPACGGRVGIPRLAPQGRCHGCGRRVWVSWRK